MDTDIGAARKDIERWWNEKHKGKVPWRGRTEFSDDVPGWAIMLPEDWGADLLEWFVRCGGPLCLVRIHDGAEVSVPYAMSWLTVTAVLRERGMTATKDEIQAELERLARAEDDRERTARRDIEREWNQKHKELDWRTELSDDVPGWAIMRRVLPEDWNGDLLESVLPLGRLSLVRLHDRADVYIPIDLSWPIASAVIRAGGTTATGGEILAELARRAAAERERGQAEAQARHEREHAVALAKHSRERSVARAKRR